MTSLLGLVLLAALVLGGLYLYWKVDQLDRRIEQQRGSDSSGASHEKP